jgi:excisionase family DNA binding protein
VQQPHNQSPGDAAIMSSPIVIRKILFTVDEAAERLGLRSSWLYERTRRSAIPHRRLGKYVRFTEEDLQAISDAAASGALQ